MRLMRTGHTKQWMRRCVVMLCITMIALSIAAWIAAQGRFRWTVICKGWWVVGINTSDGWVTCYLLRGAAPMKDWEISTGHHNKPLSARELTSAFGASRFGFGYQYRASGPIAAGYPPFFVIGILMPWWFVVLLLLVAPARLMWLRMRQRTMRRSNLCVFCGYDLRASAGRCPECGAMP